MRSVGGNENWRPGRQKDIGVVLLGYKLRARCGCQVGGAIILLAAAEKRLHCYGCVRPMPMVAFPVSSCESLSLLIGQWRRGFLFCFFILLMLGLPSK